MFSIHNHLLTGANYVASPNIGGKLKGGGPDSIIIHYTAGPNAASAIKTLSDKNAVNPASAHLVVARDGKVTQLVPFDTIAWHAGKSTYQGRSGFNQFSVGIEIDNAGELKLSDNRYFAWFGTEYPSSEVLKLRHRNKTSESYWHAYTPEQIEVVKDICSALCKAYRIDMILGHEEIAPLRKVDPGPAFPLDEMRLSIFSAHDDDGPDEFVVRDGIVNADLLNLRASPELGAIVQKLSRETKVKILEESKGWYRVETSQTGWVKKDFIK